MRVALVTHKVDRNDGQGRVNYEIARTLLAEGHAVTVIAEFCSDEIANHPLGRFVCMRHHPVPTQALRNLYFAVKSGRWIRRHRAEFDLIQANGFVMWEPADIVAVHFVHTAWVRSAYFPHRWSLLNPYDDYQRLLTLFNAFFERRAFRQARVLIAVSQSTAREVEALGNAPSRLRVVYNGVDLDEFHPGPGDRGAFGLPAEVPLALFVGDIRTPRKNLETVLHALCQVPGVHLAVAGKVEESPYPALAAQLGIAERVHFIGTTREIPLLMRSADVFVIPSRYEPYGLVVLEAMASGLPVIVSANVGAAELAAASSMVLEDANDTDTLAGYLRRLLDEKAGLREMAQAGLQNVSTLSWSDMANGYVAIYEEMISSSGGSA